MKMKYYNLLEASKELRLDSRTLRKKIDDGSITAIISGVGQSKRYKLPKTEIAKIKKELKIASRWCPVSYRSVDK